MNEISPFLVVSIPYLTALLAGFFGGLHCIGMCGGVTGAMVLGIPKESRRGRDIWPYLLNYNLGRILTYTTLGVLTGFLGHQAGELIGQYNGWLWLRILAGGLMVAMGLYLAGWWSGLIHLEKLGGQLVWQKLRPLGGQLLPVVSPAGALPFGLVWGLLPCGLIYTMLVWSLASGCWWQGGLFLLSFGIGTLPVMLATGWIAGQYGNGSHVKKWRKLAGAMVILFGLWTVASSILGKINVGLGCLPPG